MYSRRSCIDEYGLSATSTQNWNNFWMSHQPKTEVIHRNLYKGVLFHWRRVRNMDLQQYNLFQKAVDFVSFAQWCFSVEKDKTKAANDDWGPFLKFLFIPLNLHLLFHFYLKIITILYFLQHLLLTVVHTCTECTGFPFFFQIW